MAAAAPPVDASAAAPAAAGKARGRQRARGRVSEAAERAVSDMMLSGPVAVVGLHCSSPTCHYPVSLSQAGQCWEWPRV